MEKTRQAASQITTKPISAATGCAISAATRDQFLRLAGAEVASAEDERADSPRGVLEFMGCLHVEVAWARQGYVDDLGDASGPCRHHHHPVGEQYGFRNRV